MGRTASGDPQAFRGRSASANLDNFVRSSSGVTTGGVTELQRQPDPRLSTATAATCRRPPARSASPRRAGTRRPRPPRGRNIDPRATPVSDGVINVANRPGQFAAPGELDTNYTPNAVDASSLPGGMQVGGPANLSDYTTLNTTTINQLTPAQIKQLQSTDTTPRLPGQTPSNGSTNSSPTDAAQQQTLNSAVNSAIAPVGANAGGTTAGSAARSTPGSAVGAASVDSAAISNAVSPAGAPELGTVVRMTPKVAKVGESSQAGNVAADEGPSVPDRQRRRRTVPSPAKRLR